ncbi:hypothetical protein THH46_04340 [Pseudomonas sp. NA13]
MDSLTLAWWRQPDIAFTLNYGQLAAQAEIEASRTICRELSIPHHVIEIDCRQLGSGIWPAHKLTTWLRPRTGGHTGTRCWSRWRR